MTDQSRQNSVTFITTCKGRLHHLKQSLPLMMAEGPDEVIVVDYDCPQNAGVWAFSSFHSVKAIKVRNAPIFSAARARNIGAGHASSKWLCFIDADIIVQPGWLAWLREHLREGFFYTQARIKGERRDGTHGTCLCERAAYEAAGGYDEVMQGWGGEDDDFFHKLNRAGFRSAEFPHHLISAIRHTNEERTKFYAERDEVKSYAVSRLYRLAKYQAMEFFRTEGELSEQMRRTIYREIEKQFRDWSSKGSGEGQLPRIKISLTGSEHLSSTYSFSKKCIINLDVTRKTKIAPDVSAQLAMQDA